MISKHSLAQRPSAWDSFVTCGRRGNLFLDGFVLSLSRPFYDEPGLGVSTVIMLNQSLYCILDKLF